MPRSAISTFRRKFFRKLADDTLLIMPKGIATIADSDNPASRHISRLLAEELGAKKVQKRPAGQTLGTRFEIHCLEFLKDCFSKLQHLRPGEWELKRHGNAIDNFDQYDHLAMLAVLGETHQSLLSIIGADYIIAPDITVSRKKLDDDEINAPAFIVDENHAERTSLRPLETSKPILHASISCKWTLRSDRAQNARSEALNLVRNRKGRLPHVIAITGEPLPSRIASLALGTGDLDCVYHFALPELLEIIHGSSYDDAKEMMNIMVEGRRLRDIADLPFDLAV